MKTYWLKKILTNFCNHNSTCIKYYKNYYLEIFPSPSKSASAKILEASSY